MNIHKNARLTPLGRERLVRMMESGHTPQAAARAAGVCPRTALKWLARYRAEGLGGLQDRSSRPLKLRRPTPVDTVERIKAWRRQRWTGKHIAQEVGVSPATVSRVLKRAGLSQLKDLEPAPPVRRYERKTPGEMIHLDIKKLGRFQRVGHRITGDRRGQSTPRGRKSGGYGWEYIHVAIDDHSRLAFTQLHANEKAVSAIKHLKAAVAWYRKLGVNVERVMTDNGSCYRAKDFAKACKRLKIRHIRTKPYTPKTNGKAERFIQTCLRKWAFVRPYRTSAARSRAFPTFLDSYNLSRPHRALGNVPPLFHFLMRCEQPHEI